MIVSNNKKQICAYKIEGIKIIIPQFDRKEKQFDKWIEKFEVCCHTRLCGGFLKEDECGIPRKMTGAFDRNNKIATLEKEAVFKNTRCMALLVMSLVTPTCRVMIHASKTKQDNWSSMGRDSKVEKET